MDRGGVWRIECGVWGGGCIKGSLLRRARGSTPHCRSPSRCKGHWPVQRRPAPCHRFDLTLSTHGRHVRAMSPAGGWSAWRTGLVRRWMRNTRDPRRGCVHDVLTSGGVNAMTCIKFTRAESS